jgi:hypothetical protein
VEVACGPVRLRLTCPEALEPPRVVAGREHPPLGWVSRALGVKVPSPTDVCQGRRGAGTLETRIRVVHPD